MNTSVIPPLTLRPCPFCGHSPRIWKSAKSPDPYRVDCACLACPAKCGVLAKTATDACRRWNQRALSPTAAATEELVLAVEALHAEIGFRLDDPRYRLRDRVTAALARMHGPSTFVDSLPTPSRSMVPNCPQPDPPPFRPIVYGAGPEVKS